MVVISLINKLLLMIYKLLYCNLIDDEETIVVPKTTTTHSPVTTSPVTPTETPEIFEEDVKIGDNNAVVKAEVPEGAFNVPVILVVVPLRVPEDVKTQLNNKFNLEDPPVYMFDISFVTADRKREEVEPEGNVRVGITLVNIPFIPIVAFHVNDDTGDVERVRFTVIDRSTNTIKFYATEFSPYGIAGISDGTESTTTTTSKEPKTTTTTTTTSKEPKTTTTTTTTSKEPKTTTTTTTTSKEPKTTTTTTTTSKEPKTTTTTTTTSKEPKTTTTTTTTSKEPKTTTTTSKEPKTTTIYTTIISTVEEIPSDVSDVEISDIEGEVTEKPGEDDNESEDEEENNNIEGKDDVEDIKEVPNEDDNESEDEEENNNIEGKDDVEDIKEVPNEDDNESEDEEENDKNISKDGKCGKGVGSCKKGYCCSKYGWCGKSDRHCKVEEGCQSEFGDCKKVTVKVTKVKTVTKSKSKGSTNKCGEGYGSCKEGYCCSKYGWCGKTDDYCSLSKGCQSEFGECYGKSKIYKGYYGKSGKVNNKSSESSNDWKCGKKYGSCKEGYCCSKYGWCGKSNAYCDKNKGCQSEFGKCF